MSHLIQQFFSSQIENDPIKHIHRLETTTLFDEKLSSISQLVTLSNNQDYDGFFLKNEKESQEKNGSELHSFVLNRLVDLLVQDVENESLAENYITILLNIISRVVSNKTLQNKIGILFKNVNFIHVLLACLSKKSPYVVKNTLSLFQILYKYDNTVAFLLQKYKGLGYFITLLKNATMELELKDDEHAFFVKESTLQFLILLTQRDSNRVFNQMEKTQQEEIMKFLVFEDIFSELVFIVNHSVDELKVLALELMKNLVSISESNQKIFIQSNIFSSLAPKLQFSSITKKEISSLSFRLFSDFKIFNQIRLLILQILNYILESQLSIKKELVSRYEGLILSSITNLSLMKDIKTILSEIEVKGGFINKDESFDWNIDFIEMIQVESLKTLGIAFELSRNIQQGFSSMQDLIYDDEFACCALVRLTRMALYNNSEIIKKSSLKTLLQYIHNNEEGQYMVATTYRLRSQSLKEKKDSGLSCGISLTEAILSHQPQSGALNSSEIFVKILQQNPKCEIVLLEKPFDDSTNPPISFFDTILKDLLKSLRDGAATQGRDYIIAQLKLICQCLYSSNDACKRFIHVSGGPIFLLDFYKQILLIEDNSNQEFGIASYIKGLLTILIGLLAMYFPNDNSVSSGQIEMGQVTKKSLHDVIFRRVGVNQIEQELIQFNNLIDKYDNKEYFDFNFITQVKIWKEMLITYFKKPEEERLSTLDIKSLREKLSKEFQEQLNNEKSNFQSKIKELNNSIQQKENELQSLKTQYFDCNKKIENMNKEIEILKKEASRVSEIEILTKDIQSLKIQNEESQKIQQATIQNLQTQLNQKQAELAKLNEVYSMMDSEHDDELDSLRQQQITLKNQIQILEKQKQEQAAIIQRLNDENIMNQLELSKKSNVSMEELKLMESKFEDQINEKTSKHVEEISILNSKIQKLDKDSESFLFAIGQKDQQIMSLQQKIQQLEGKVYEKSIQANEQQEMIGHLSKDIEMKNNIISQLESKLQVANMPLSPQEEQEVVFKNSNYLNLLKQVKEMETQIQNLQISVKNGEKRIQELEADNEDLMQIVEMLENKNGN